MTNIKAYMVGTLTILFALAITFTSGFAGQQQKVTVTVDGLACPFCAYGMEKKLKRLENLEKLDIKINDGLVILYFKEGAKIDTALIAKKVKEAGFTAREIKLENPAAHSSIPSKQVVLNVEGMRCPDCVSRVEAALTKIECVKEVSVSLDDNEATVECRGGDDDRAKLVQAVNKLGFKAKVIAISD